MTERDSNMSSTRKDIEHVYRQYDTARLTKVVELFHIGLSDIAYQS